MRTKLFSVLVVLVLAFCVLFLFGCGNSDGGDVTTAASTTTAPVTTAPTTTAAPAPITVSGSTYAFVAGSGVLTWYGEEEMSEEDFRFLEEQLDYNFGSSLLQFSGEASYSFNYILYGFRSSETVEGTREGNTITYEREGGGVFVVELSSSYLTLIIRPYLDSDLEARLTFLRQ